MPAQSKVTTISNQRSRGIPYHLKILPNGKPFWNMANNVLSLRELLIFDLNRMPNLGWMDFAANNYEGRIAWSQAYYLKGLLTLIDKKSGLLHIPHSSIDKLINYTLQEELQLLATLSEQKMPGYLVRRYSMDREPLLFSLHLSRIANILSYANTVYPKTSIFLKALRSVCSELDLAHTVEEIKSDNHNMVVMSYKIGLPFWADGANVPYNYVSGYILGVALSCPTKSNLMKASALIDPLLSELNPKPLTWRYWGGLGDKGWNKSDKVSINTPEWRGNRAAKAHITYRSMDAAAIIALYRVNPALIPMSLIDHIRYLVKSGLLLPSVNQELYTINKPADLDEIVAKFYSRSTTPWEIPSQIYALDALARSKRFTPQLIPKK